MSVTVILRVSAVFLLDVTGITNTSSSPSFSVFSSFALYFSVFPAYSTSMVSIPEYASEVFNRTSNLSEFTAR